MAAGVTADQYWNGDPTLLKYYLRCDEIRQERRNEAAWLQGMYIAEAIQASFAKNHKYPNEPYALTKAEKERRAERERQEADAKFFDYMMTMTEHLNRRIMKRKKSQEAEADECSDSRN